MMSNIRKFIFEKEWLVVGIFVVVFLLIRFPGLDSPLHQDEYKWPMSVNPSLQTDAFIPHPPVGEIIYKTAGRLVGFDIHFRIVPLFFGTINLLLLFYFLRKFFGKKEAFIGITIWTLSYFSVLASLMVDTDGQVMPFFFILGLISYYHLKLDYSSFKWWSFLLISLLLGFLVKLSFSLAIGAIILDFLWRKKDKFTRKQYLLYGGYVVGGIITLFVFLYVSKFFFSFFDFDKSLTYWKHFLVIDRGWMQTAIQCVKSVFYTSPFLVLIPLFKPKLVFEKTRVFVLFLVLAFIFYIVLFDFSIGALDRYLQLLILPLTIMSSVVIGSINFSSEKRTKEFLLLGAIFALVLFLLQSLPHAVYALHPKSEWISRIVSLKWNFLYPFSGGSGPLGFYVSFLFLGLSWFISVLVLALSYTKYNLKNVLIVFLIPVGLVYNLTFTLEYLFGYQNGSAPRLLSNVVEFIKNDPNIKMVTVYNDNGGDDIQKIGKYRKRLYTDPKFDVVEKVKNLNLFKEHYFVLDIPRIDPESVYTKYLGSCSVIYTEVDKKISAKIYDCTNAPNLKI